MAGTDLQIVQFDSNGIASLGLADAPKALTGISKLVQIVIIGFLKNPGQDVIDSDDGSGLRSDIGQYNFTDGDAQEIQHHVVLRNQAVKQEVLQRQEGTLSDSSEKLKDLKILDVGFDPSTSSAFLRVQVINEAGDTADVVV